MILKKVEAYLIKPYGRHKSAYVAPRLTMGAKLLRAAGFNACDTLEITVCDGRIVITKALGAANVAKNTEGKLPEQTTFYEEILNSMDDFFSRVGRSAP